MESSTVALLTKSFPYMLQGALLTLKISCIAVVIGVIGGLVIGTANCKKLRMPGVGHLIDLFTIVVRGTPIYVQILIAYFALPSLLNINLSAMTAGLIALGANSTAYVGEIVRSGLNSIPPGQWDAAYVLGYSRFLTLRFIILPQMLRNVLPAITNELITLIKETSLLSTIGLLELTRVSRNIIARELDPMTIYLAAAAFYLVMTTSVSVASGILERRLSHD